MATWDETDAARLDAAGNVDTALKDLLTRLDEYEAAVAANAETANQLPNVNVAEARARLLDTKVCDLVVGVVGDRYAHLVTKPGGIRSQRDADSALLAELSRYR
jgi:hypothetical protein